MSQNGALFSYRNASSVIHKIPSGIKLIFLCFASVRIFSNGDYHFFSAQAIFTEYAVWLRLGIYAVLLCVMFFLARTPPSSLKKLCFVFVLGLCLVCFSVVSVLSSGSTDFYEAILSDALYTARFFLTSLAALIVFETTSRLEILDFFEQIENAVGKAFPLAKNVRFSLLLSVTLTFIPEIFSVWQKTGYAVKARLLQQKSRKVSKNPLNSVITTVRVLNVRLSALFFTMICYAEDVRKAVVCKSARNSR